MTLFKRVGDVLEEYQAKGDVLVLGGIHVAAHFVGGGPKFLLEAEVGDGAVLSDGSVLCGQGASPCTFCLNLALQRF